MIRSRLMFLSGVLAVAACADPTTLPRSPSSIPDASVPSQLQVIQGVVEMIDDTHFGVRQSETVVTPILFDSDVLMNLLGKEVILWGRFTDGIFSVTRLELAVGDGDALFRVRPTRHPSAASGRRM